MKKFLFVLLAAALALPMMAQVKVENKEAFKTSKSYVVAKQALNAPFQYKNTLRATKAEIPAGYAMVTLSAGDIWGDGSGYQMLLDADANAYGTIIPETGALTSGGDVDAAIYAEFEYKIPENADGALSTANIVFDGEVSIMVPAGVYDWCITNPTPGDRMWISSSNGTVPGRYDDFEFAEGCTYIFTIGVFGQNDGVTLQVLEPGISLTTPENLTVVPGDTYANVSWEDNDDMIWNLRYRVYNPNEGGFWDFEDDAQLDGWMIYDYDGDGDNWYYNTSCDLAHSGSCVLASDSYYWGALTPDNWLISPEVNLNGTLSFWASGAYSSWYDEVFRVYVGPTDWETVDDFIPVSEDITTNYGMTEYTFDMSEFEGEKGVVAIRHYNCSDVYTLLIDDFSIGEPGNEWITVEGITDLEAVLEGLDPETTYEVQVQATGNAGFSSEWSESVLFTTLAAGTPEPEQTEMPEITYEVQDDAVIITATGEGEVLLYIDGVLVDNPVTIARGTEEFTVTATATAQGEDMLISDVATLEITIPAVGGETPEDPYATGYWVVFIDKDGNPQYYKLEPGDDPNGVQTSVALGYGLYGVPTQDDWFNVDFYFLVDGVMYAADEFEKEPNYGNANENPLFEGENYWAVPVGYKYVVGILTDPDTGDLYMQISKGILVGVDEFSADKTVAGVRYFNMAGQEMSEVNGMTIVVTTYTDGTTSAAKVIK